MTYTLAAAAKATGLNKWMILRAIRSGEITGTNDSFGNWHVEPDELHRVYPPVEGRHAGNDAPSPPTVPDAVTLETEIGTLVKEDAELHRHDEAKHDTDQRARRPWWRRIPRRSSAWG